MTALDQAYADLLAAKTDMQFHMPKLKELAAGKRVIEFGTRRGVSTVALLAGRPRSLITYDMVRTKDVTVIEALARAAQIRFDFCNADIEKLYSVGPCDLGFVDAMHNADSVAIYLRLLLEAGATTIALHDTYSFARTGDLPGTKGILDAIDGFLAANKDWRMSYHTDECYGMTVLEAST